MDLRTFWQQTALPIAAAFSSVLVTACSFNPVTGENQLSLMSQNDELNLGKQQYSPTQQSQGGQWRSVKRLTIKQSIASGKQLAAINADIGPLTAEQAQYYQAKVIKVQ